jgi:hypothetical protein
MHKHHLPLFLRTATPIMVALLLTSFVRAGLWS